MLQSSNETVEVENTGQENGKQTKISLRNVGKAVLYLFSCDFSAPNTQSLP